VLLLQHLEQGPPQGVVRLPLEADAEVQALLLGHAPARLELARQSGQQGRGLGIAVAGKEAAQDLRRLVVAVLPHERGGEGPVEGRVVGEVGQAAPGDLLRGAPFAGALVELEERGPGPAGIRKEVGRPREMADGVFGLVPGLRLLRGPYEEVLQDLGDGRRTGLSPVEVLALADARAVDGRSGSGQPDEA
jgi:hypothetical protein